MPSIRQFRPNLDVLARFPYTRLENLSIEFENTISWPPTPLVRQLAIPSSYCNPSRRSEFRTDHWTTVFSKYNAMQQQSHSKNAIRLLT